MLGMWISDVRGHDEEIKKRKLYQVRSVIADLDDRYEDPNHVIQVLTRYLDGFTGRRPTHLRLALK
jgi:hypothetical protein